MPRGKPNRDVLKGCELHGQYRGDECPMCKLETEMGLHEKGCACFTCASKRFSK